MTRASARLTAGIVVGGLLAAGAAIAQREIARRAHGPLIDWPEVRQIARRRLSAGRAGTSARLTPADRRVAEELYADALRTVEPLVAQRMGAVLPHPLGRPLAVDRLEWVDLNLATFEHLLGRLEVHVAPPTARGNTAHGLARLANRFVGTRQLGYLLGFLGSRVLGQYDLGLLASQADDRGQLYFVEPNVRATAAGMQIPLDEFRTFIAIHETTHAFEFEAHPWLRRHFRELVDLTIERMAADPGRLAERVAAAIRAGDGHWFERMLTTEQREVFARTQALMALLEGYANHVMHRVGAEVLPTFDDVHAKFERRNQRRTGIEKVVLRLTGLDLKLEQYVVGERFVDAVLARGGTEALARVWSGPEFLPTLDELAHPDAWLARTQPPSNTLLA